MNMSTSKWNHKVWIARSHDGSLELFLIKPQKGKYRDWIASQKAIIKIPVRFYPEVTVDNSPQELIVDSNLTAASD